MRRAYQHNLFWIREVVMPAATQLSSFVSLIPLIGIFVTLSGIVAMLGFGAYQMKKRFEWDKAMLAYEILKTWTEKTIVHREVVEAKYGTYLMNLDPITPPRMRNLC
jgi:hypothetical protein